MKNKKKKKFIRREYALYVVIYIFKKKQRIKMLVSVIITLKKELG